ncbi:MAG: S8 family serine peptidase [Candidatus Thioglobus sp.]|nr:S8 family serine peptidase [Candidatus Thioglobus sp.]
MITNTMIIVFMTVFLLGSLGGGSSSNSTTSICSTSNVLCSGTSLTYNSSNASTQAATTEFQNLNYSSAASSQNPLEVINAHKAYGYGLTGSGETIAILDAGFSTSHDELDSKTITQYGTQTAATGVNATADHGLIVSSVAAGEDDGTGMQGVAPGVSLHWASYNQRNGNTYYPTHWANATDNASSAVVQNNSWGIDYQIDTLQSDISSNSWTNAYGIAQKFHSSGYTANETSANAYITALDNFQDHGVVVYALSNTSSYTDADFQAALPVLFSQLEEAWITAVNVEITGSSGNETYTRKSAPCGSTGKYCLGADGYQIVGAAYDSSATNLYWQGVSGTSFVAPQISGAVALLAEAFPNHNPEQLTDRLLASADNTFFSHDASVTFGNGVSHGYDDEFGHGILDIYAALNPITSSAYTRIYTGDSSDGSESYQLGNSKLLTSNSLGDSLQKGLIGEVGYTYDDLGGGFEYDMSYHVNLISNNKPKFNLSEELKSLTNPIDNSLKTKDSFNLNQGISIGLSALPVQSFFGSNTYSPTNLQSYHTPYLDSNEGGLGIGGTFNISNARLLVGATMPIEFNNGQKIGSKKSLVSSLEYGNPQSQSVTLMTGLSQENDSLLGSIGSNAFSLDGAKSTTTFTALKAQKHLLDNFSLTGIVTHANTNMTSPSNSLVDSARDVKSSSIALVADMRNLSNDDQLSIFVNQPNRVDSGSIAIKTASLADSNRNINQTIKNIDLDSSSRQLNYGLSYRKDLNENLAFSVKHIITNNLNHSDNSNRLHSSYIGMDYKDLKLGFASNPNDSSIETELSYAIAL